jgi:cytosine/adenosine deaminase-related metal-dependent hydrolase
MALASGVCPVPQLLEAGVNVAFGGDSSGCNFTIDVLSHLGLGALLQKVHTLNPRIITANHVLEMATRNGARAFGMEHLLGSLEVGKKADLIAIDTQNPHLQPLHDPVAAVVYGATGMDVAYVFIDGNLILKEKRFVAINQEEIQQNASETAFRIQEDIKRERK